LPSARPVFWKPIAFADFFAVEKHVVIVYAQDRIVGAVEHAPST